MRTSVFIGTALALTLGVATASAPAIAKDKPAAAEAIGEKIRPALSAAQEALTKKDYAATLIQVDKAAPLASTPYEKFLVGQFRAIAGQATKDNKAMIQGLDEAVDSGYTATGNAGFALMSGQLAYNAGDYNRAINRLQIAQKLGSTEEALPLLIADSYYKSNRTAEGLAVVEQAYAADKAANRVTPQDTLARAAQAALTAKMGSATQLWLTRLVTTYPSTANWHDLLAIYRDQHPTISPQGLLDLYRLMKATNSFKNPREIEEYAEVALDKKGLPGEAKAAFDDAQASGGITQMTKGMTEIKTLATTKAVADKASLPAYIKQAPSAPNGRVARGTADALFGYKDYAQAIALYKVAQQKGGIDARLINMGLGESYALSGDKASARAAFAAVDGEGAELAKLWILWLDQTK